MLGTRRFLDAEQDVRMGEELRQIAQDNTARLYMAFTRAGFRLSIIWSGAQPDPLPSAWSQMGPEASRCGGYAKER